MKINIPRRDLLLIFTPLFLLFAVFSFWFFKGALSIIFLAHWGILIAAFIIMLLPRSSQKLKSEATQPLPIQIWLMKIMLMQLSLYAISYGLCGLLNIKNNVEPVLFLTHFGLFPWALIAIIASRMGMVAFVQGEDAYMSDCTKPVTHSDHKQFWGLKLNYDTKLLTYFTFSLTAASMCLLFSLLFNSKAIPIRMNMNPISIFLSVVLLVLIVNGVMRKWLYQLLAKRFPVYISALISLFLIAAVFILFSWFFAGFNLPSFTVPTFSNLNLQHHNALAKLLLLCFWIGWTPVISVYVARLSKGYSIRQLIAGVLLLPLVIAIIEIALSTLHFSLHTSSVLISGLISLAGFIYLMKALMSPGMLSSLILSYLPKHGNTKHRDYYPFMKNFITLTILFFYCYVFAGAAGIVLLQWIATLPFIFDVPLIVLAGFF